MDDGAKLQKNDKFLADKYNNLFLRFQVMVLLKLHYVCLGKCLLFRLVFPKVATT